MQHILDDSEYETLSALPRILPREAGAMQASKRLTDLEQMRTMYSMLPRKQVEGQPQAALETDEAWAGWKYPQAALIGVLPQQQPFRRDPCGMARLVFLPDEDEEGLLLHRVENDPDRRGRPLYVPIDLSLRRNHPLPLGERIDAWGGFDLMTLLSEQAEHFGMSLRSCAERFATVEVPAWAGGSGWRWHPFLGFALAS